MYDPNISKNRSAASQGIKVYFPSELGSDYDAWETAAVHPIMAPKKAHREAARAFDFKTISVATGYFMEFFLSPTIGTAFGELVFPVWAWDSSFSCGHYYETLPNRIRQGDVEYPWRRKCIVSCLCAS